MNRWTDAELEWPEILVTVTQALGAETDRGGELRARLLLRHKAEKEARRADISFNEGRQSAMTPERFESRMRSVRPLARGDYVAAHRMAADLLCEMLIQLGYGHGVAEFKKLQECYA